MQQHQPNRVSTAVPICIADRLPGAKNQILNFPLGQVDRLSSIGVPLLACVHKHLLVTPQHEARPSNRVFGQA